MALTPPIHVMNQEKRHGIYFDIFNNSYQFLDMHPPQKNV